MTDVKSTTSPLIGQDISAPLAPWWARGGCLLALVAAVAWCTLLGTHQIRGEEPDFSYFYKSGAWLWTHGCLDPGYDLIDGQYVHRGRLDWYWPIVSRIMTLFALLPYRTAGYIWLYLNVFTLFATLRLIGRHISGLPPSDWMVTQMLPFLLLGSYWQWVFYQAFLQSAIV